MAWGSSRRCRHAPPPPLPARRASRAALNDRLTRACAGARGCTAQYEVSEGALRPRARAHARRERRPASHRCNSPPVRARVADQDSVQMLQRSTQVGEFYRMHPPPVWDPKERLPPTYMDILVYDEEADKHQHIQFETALYAAASAFEFGTVADPNNPTPEELEAAFRFAKALGLADYADFTVANAKRDYLLRTGLTAEQCNTFARTSGSGSSAKSSWKPIKFTSVETACDDIIANVKAGHWMPLCIVIARPFIEHLMMSAIMTVSGRDTGATLFGPADMQISANTSVKTIEGHYTCDVANNSNLTHSPWVPPPHTHWNTIRLRQWIHVQEASNLAVSGVHFGTENLLLELLVGTFWRSDRENERRAALGRVGAQHTQPLQLAYRQFPDKKKSQTLVDCGENKQIGISSGIRNLLLTNFLGHLGLKSAACHCSNDLVLNAQAIYKAVDVTVRLVWPLVLAIDNEGLHEHLRCDFALRVFGALHAKLQL